MKPADDREEVLFREALQRASGPERKGFLDGVCRGDDALRARLEALLQSDESAKPFLDPQAASAAAATVLLPPEEGPGTVIGRYKILEKIGEGGFGVVYVAEQREPVKRRVALKIIKLGMDTKQVVARFEAERQALALMDHPNIAKVLDAGATDTGRPYFVMELVKGIPITRYCDQEKLGTRERLDLFIQICHAIQHAHQKGIIHRDIKPSNILVTLHDGVPVPKVIDFGIAKATQQELTEKTVYTQFQQFIGTPAYMSPEQAEMSGLDIDTRSDIYSLGVLLYELLTGTTPFDTKELLRSGVDEMRKIIREREPVRPSTRLRQTAVTASPSPLATRHSPLATDLDWIVMKCLEKDRARRYETANGLAQDIERHLKNEPVVARPPSVGYRLQKSFRRNKLVFTAGGTVGLALVLGVVVSSWQAMRAMKAGRREAEARLRADGEKGRAEKEAQKAKASELAARQNLYTADMNLVQQAWEQNNAGQVRRLLEETATYPDLGFEWYYWQRQRHTELQTLRGHSGTVVSVAFSPDGRRIVTGSFDRTAKVWDASSGKELFTLRGHSAQVRWVAFSLDGRRIVTGSLDQTAKVWDAASGKELLTLKGHLAAITSVAFSPNGQRIVTGSYDRTAKVWDAATGTELLTFKGHSSSVRSVAFSPDGQRIVTGSDDQTARVWDAATSVELLTLRGHRAGLNVSVFSQDGQRILTGSGDWTGKVWDAATGNELLTLRGHRAGITFAAFSPDDRRIVTSSYDQTAKMWDAASGEQLFTLEGHGDMITSVAFSPDGQQIVTGSYDQTAKVWDAAGGKESVTLRGHTNGITSVAFCPGGQRVVTGSYDQTARVWDTDSAKELLTLRGHSARVNSVAFSVDGQRIVTGSFDRTAKVWDAATGVERLTIKGHNAYINCAALSPDGRRLVTVSQLDVIARVWDAAVGGELLTLNGHGDTITSVTFSADGQRIVTGSYDGTAKVWDAATGKELFTLKGHNGWISSVAFSLDGQRILTGSGDKTAKVWEAASGKELLSLNGHSEAITSVTFSPDGQRIVTGSYDRTAKVWDAATGKELFTLKGHNSGVSSVAFSPNGQRIITGSLDGTARVWEAASEAQVTHWRREQQATAQRWAAQERERAAATAGDRAVRAQDPGAIKQWLVLLPIGYEGRDGDRALQEEQVAQEGDLRPHVGERSKAGQNELVWRQVKLEDYLLDFNRLVGAMTEWSVAYAAAYIQSEAAQTNVVLKVGSNDQARVYLNGKLIHQWVGVGGRVYGADQDVVAGMELKAGINVLVFKVVNEVDKWLGSVRFADADGNPLKGIQVTLDPEGKD
jgi:WD40 repeat protein/tRNA A-37 threonylcarbamoyl transferase component Bud32